MYVSMSLTLGTQEAAANADPEQTTSMGRERVQGNNDKRDINSFIVKTLS